MLIRNMEAYVHDILVEFIKGELHEYELWETFECSRLRYIYPNPSKCPFKVRSEKFSGFMLNKHRIKSNKKIEGNWGDEVPHMQQNGSTWAIE